MCRTDLNYKLAYPTVKMVMVADWRLGALRYSFMLATLIYILVYALYVERGYLDIQSPDGTVTATLQRPRNANVNATQFNYCNVSQQVSDDDDTNSDKLICEVWPEDMVLFPTSIHEHMLITTRVSEQWLTMNPNCIYQNFGQYPYTNCNGNISYISSSSPKRYLAGIENYTIKITHAMLDLKHYELTGHEKYCLTGEQMVGSLLDSNGNEMKHFDVNEPLTVTVQDILDASDTNLSDLSDAVDNNGSIYKGESMRHSGILLMVIINYDNTYGTNNRNPKYTVKVIRIERAEYKVSETIYYNETYRMVRDRHGVYISFVQGGTIGKFNFQTALISLVASLGLLGVSTLIVDSMMLYCCKHKANYYNDKYDFTEAYANDPKLKILSKLHHKHDDDDDDDDDDDNNNYNNNKEELLPPGTAYTINGTDDVVDIDNMPPAHSNYNVGSMYKNTVHPTIQNDNNNNNNNRFNM